MAVRKTSAKKAAPKKAATKAPARRAPAKKAPAKPAPAPRKITAVSAAYSKTKVLAEIAENTGLTRKQVASVFEELDVLINRHVKKRAVGSFTLPGLLKITTVKKPARRARKNVPNPFKPGETMDVAARPAQTVVKARPLKRLKDMTSS